MLKIDIYDFDLDQAFCFNGYIVNGNHSFQELRLPATSGRLKVGKTNWAVEQPGKVPSFG